MVRRIHRGTRRSTITVLSLLLVTSMVAIMPAGPAALAAPPDGPDALADFEVDFPDEFFAFNGGSSTVATSRVTVGAADALARPGQSGDNTVLALDFSVGDFGGLGNSYEIAGPQDWSLTEGFSFWFHGTGSGLTYQAEISDNRSNPATDTSERFDYAFTDNAAGWHLISIPWTAFSRATDFQPGGAPDDGFTLTEIWAWAIVLPQGADVVYFDDFALDQITVDDFEAPLSSGVDGDGVDIGFYTFRDGDSTVAVSQAPQPVPVPGLPADNNVLAIDLDVVSFAGVIHGFENDTVDTWVPQD
ncbi:MAG: hypothetical protein KJP12_02260, partial [Acidimicrobiia bacterium]|nr:hypothetical protein [Acidimicrobiia bacterium]